jgi:hypothetical protein
MPEKHPNTHRWGGPGASHEDASKPMPEPVDTRPDGVSTSGRVSQVSGGGGERDEKHSHVDGMRSSKSHATDSPSPTSSRARRLNRSRNDRARDRAAMEAGSSRDDDRVADECPIFLNTDDHIPESAELEGLVEDVVRSAIGPFEPRLERVEIFLADTDGRRSTPDDKQCVIKAYPTTLDMVSVEQKGSTAEEATRRAAARLQKSLASEFDRAAGA